MQALPHGTVTFLFTDIESSTRLWHEHADAMPVAYARHDAILREAIAANGGVVYKTVGDAFQVAFPTAIDAVTAALVAQRALQAESWSLPEPLKVRMALHTGAVEPDANGDYRSPVLNRLGRLLGAGHGGQVLLSQATMELARDGLPDGASFRDLGEQRLKDLYRPERVFQLEGSGLHGDFADLLTLDTRPNNLPVQLTQFIGRQADVDAVRGLLERPEVRLVTITGPGGMGKTRLSLQVGADMLDSFRNGVFVVALDTLTDAALVPSAIAQAFGLRESADTPVTSILTTHLYGKHLLMVLDNLEQVIESATFIGELLLACPEIRILATSRVRLQLRGEREYPLAPLALPDNRVHATPVSLSQYESVRLFVERAQEVRPAFTVTNENAPAVAEICARLDGMPLAIELAAARVRMLRPEALLKRLAERLPMLTGGARDLPERQQTLRGAIAWSYELLGDEDQALFRRMSVFAGGATLEAIEAVAVDEGQGWEAFEGLERLVDQSLVRSTEVSGEPRFLMYETIREFAEAELVAHREAPEAKRRHAAYFASFDRLAHDFQTADIVAEIERIEPEQENIRSACAWAVGHDPVLAYRLVAGHGFTWYWRGVRREEVDWVRTVNSLPVPEVPPVDRARFLLAAGHTLINVPTDAETQEAVGRGLREAVDIFRDEGPIFWSRRSMTALAIHEFGLGNQDEAMSLMLELLDLTRKDGEAEPLALALNNAGYFAYLRGDYSGSLRYLDEGLHVAGAQTESADIVGVVMSSRGETLRALGRFDEAEAMFSEALRLVIGLRRPGDTWYNILGLALVAAQSGRHEFAVWLGAAYHGLRLKHDVPGEADLVMLESELESLLEHVRAEIGADAYGRVWQSGLLAMPEDVLARLDEVGVMPVGEQEMPA
jgi:predicted ATPase/class 3 adenylate cyclase